MRKIFVFAVWVVGLLVASMGQLAIGVAAELPDVLDVRVSSTPDRARLILDMSDTSAFALAHITSPDLTIAVDVKAAGAEGVSPGVPAGKGLVEAYSVEVIEPGRVRAWLRLSGPAQVQQAYSVQAVGDQPARLIVDLIPSTMAAFDAQAELDIQGASAAAEAAPAQAAPIAPAPDAPKAVADETAAQPDTVQAARPLIVLDPGHGGVDPGAEAPNGLKEKNITLAFAKALQKLLVQSGKFDVALTRTGDVFLKLDARVALARQNKADLFISIHADTFAQAEVRGASIYTRDENATDVLDKVLAEQENRVDLIAGFAVPKMDDHVVSILLDLMRRETRRQSFRAAKSINNQLQPTVRMRRFPLRKADFFVLQAPEVPSILLELGFLSNPADIDNLSSSSWRGKVAEALSRGITAYFDGLEAQ